MSIRLKIFLFIFFLFFAAIGNAILTFQLEEYEEVKLSWVIHTHEVILDVNQLLSEIKDAETGQRGYLLTGNSIYLAPYHTGIANIKVLYTELLRKTADNPKQQKRLKDLDKIIISKLAELKLTIDLMQAGKSQESLNLVKQNLGKRDMDDIRSTLKDFIHEEKLLLETRKGDFRENRGMITTFITLEIMFFLFLALITVSFLNKNLFNPLKMLLDSTHKMQEGKKVGIADITSKDEMGFLITSFFKMQEVVFQREEALEHEAHHDKLTGLMNRAQLFQEIELAIDGAEKQGTLSSLIFIDLNKFKELNDTLGHDAGDFLLIETANRLNGNLREKDKVFRIGGDEFLVLLTESKDLKEVKQVVSHILEAFKTPTYIQGKTINILLSLGVATAPTDSVNAKELLKMADVAMYSAKTDSQVNYKFFDDSMLKRSSD